ncbi:MAG: AAA family ATPase [Proteobacteria bacterium]|nr:AAA family ATPase [Pseudomonadota bacterium]
MLASEAPASRALGTDGRIIAFVNDDETGNALRLGLISNADMLTIQSGGLRHAVRYLQKSAFSGMIIVDIEGIEDTASALDDLARVCPPDVRVVVIGTNTDIGFYRLLVNELGVTEYLPKPLTRDSVQQFILRHVSDDQSVAPATRGGRVIAVCGVRGGAGATTIAVGLASELARVTKGHVALLDLHVQNGTAAVMLGGRPGQGLRVALEDPDRADVLFLERTAIPIGPRLRLIAAEEGFETTPEITEAGVARVLDLLRQKFNYIVVDLPVPPPRSMVRIFGLARHVVVVLRPDVAGLRDAKALRRFVTGATGADRVMTLVNRSDAKGALTPALVKEGLGLTPEVTIPDLGVGLTQAFNLGVPATEKVPALRSHLAPIVREVAGVRSSGTTRLLRRLFRR